MKTRLISALIGLVILFAVLFCFDTIVLNIAIAIISALSVYELLKATNSERPRIPEIICIFTAALIPFSPMKIFRNFLPLCVYILVLTLFCVQIKYHKTMKFEQIASDFFFAFAVPVTYTMIIYFRDNNSFFVGMYYVLVSLGASWLTDTGAYFVGVNFGKRKLCPEISPKKTVEGAVGGVCVCVASLLLVSFLFEKIAGYFGGEITANYLYILIFAPILSIISMVGDLSASAIKRQHGVKDFGNIMPGHGGVVDRFDSVLMVLPAVYIISKFFPFAA